MFDFPSPATPGQVYASGGVSYAFDGLVWNIVASAAAATVGDVKQGLQMADHDGWILLNGRAVSTLTATQQAAAATFGFTANLPNAVGCVPYMPSLGATPGNVAGNNAKTITQANLPAVTLTSSQAASTAATSSNAGNHQHVYQSNINDQGIQNFNELLSGRGGNDPATKYPVVKWRGSATIANDANNGTIRDGFAHNVAGDHNHSMTVPAHNHTLALGGSGTALDVTPRNITLNYFVWLGL